MGNNMDPDQTAPWDRKKITFVSLVFLMALSLFLHCGYVCCLMQMIVAFLGYCVFYNHWFYLIVVTCIFHELFSMSWICVLGILPRHDPVSFIKNFLHSFFLFLNCQPSAGFCK